MTDNIIDMMSREIHATILYEKRNKKYKQPIIKLISIVTIMS
jgi:hypothetical protein